MRPSGSGWSPAWLSLNGRVIPRQKGEEVCPEKTRPVIFVLSDERHVFLLVTEASRVHSGYP